MVSAVVFLKDFVTNFAMSCRMMGCQAAPEPEPMPMPWKTTSATSRVLGTNPFPLVVLWPKLWFNIGSNVVKTC